MKFVKMVFPVVYIHLNKNRTIRRAIEKSYMPQLVKMYGIQSLYEAYN